MCTASQKVHCYVISLESSERRNNITYQLKGISLSYSFFPAIDGSKWTSNEATNNLYNREICFERYNRLLSSGEVACALSHREVLKEIIKNDVPGAIILEDDALIDNSIVKFSEAIYDTNFADVILLGHSRLEGSREPIHYFYNPIFRKTKVSKFIFGTPFSLRTSGTVGYYVSRSGAKKILQLPDKVVCVADDWPFYSSQGITIKELRPCIVREDFKTFSSTLEHSRSQLSSSLLTLPTYMKDFMKALIGVYRKLIVSCVPSYRSDD